MPLQSQAEMESLIEGICSAHEDFSRKQAELVSQLDCISKDEDQRQNQQLEELPELGEGPDEVCS